VFSSGFSFATTAERQLEFDLPETVGPATVRVALDESFFVAEDEYNPTDIDTISLYTGGAGAGAELIIDEIRLVGSSADLAGDNNGDGFVSQADLDLVLLNWGESVLPGGWVAADQFDGELISQNELDGVLLNWGDGTPPSVAVPEPGVGVVLLAGLVALRRRVAG
ncbi:MAG: hypothetical protein AAGL98_09140, partial [Planctomycetota bacterium]